MSAAAEAIPGPQPLDELVTFIRAHGRPCFERWPDAILREYLDWHAACRSLVIVRRMDKRVVGLGVGWQCDRDELEKHWFCTKPSGACFYFAHCIATEPASLRAMIDEWHRRIPRWHELELYVRRRDRGLIQYPQRLLHRLYARAL